MKPGQIWSLETNTIREGYFIERDIVAAHLNRIHESNLFDPVSQARRCCPSHIRDDCTVGRHDASVNQLSVNQTLHQRNIHDESINIAGSVARLCQAKHAGRAYPDTTGDGSKPSGCKLSKPAVCYLIER